MKERRVYTAEFKREAVRLSEQAGVSVVQIAQAALGLFLKEVLLHSLLTDVDSLSQLPGVPKLKLVMYGCNS